MESTPQNKIFSNLDDSDAMRLMVDELLNILGMSPEALRQILTDFLMGSTTLDELPECPDLKNELISTFVYWKISNKEFELNEFISVLRIVIRFSDPNKSIQFDEYFDAIDREYDVQSIIDRFTKGQIIPREII